MSKVVCWKNRLLDTKNLKKPTHVITAIMIDGFSDMVSIIIEKGMNVNVVKLTMENAEEIGFINLNALEKYCI